MNTTLDVHFRLLWDGYISIYSSNATKRRRANPLVFDLGLKAEMTFSRVIVAFETIIREEFVTNLGLKKLSVNCQRIADEY
jgi:hypothetical protein